MATTVITRTGVVAELDGLYWGVQYEDGHSRSYAFGPINQAEISDPNYCKRPRDMTYTGSPYIGQLDRAELVPITVTTTYKTGSPATPAGYAKCTHSMADAIDVAESQWSIDGFCAACAWHASRPAKPPVVYPAQIEATLKAAGWSLSLQAITAVLEAAKAHPMAADGWQTLDGQPVHCPSCTCWELDRAGLTLPTVGPKEERTPISSPSAVCGLIGCARRDVHAHTVIVDR